MRAARFVAVGTVVAAVASCSLITSFQGLGAGGAGGASTTTSSHGPAGSGGQHEGGGGHGGVAGTGGAGGAGGAVGSGGSGGGVAGGGGGDGGQPLCEEGHYYCGGHGVPGNSHSLYACTLGAPVFAAHCYDGCVDGTNNDRCKCKVPGRYCGGDDIVGDPNSLYTCDGAGPKGPLYKVCTNGCVIGAVGHDDTCAN